MSFASVYPHYIAKAKLARRRAMEKILRSSE